jgi:hypothetical protein
VARSGTGTRLSATGRPSTRKIYDRESRVGTWNPNYGNPTPDRQLAVGKAKTAPGASPPAIEDRPDVTENIPVAAES